MSTSAIVAALKKVDFPQDGFPTSPINIFESELRALKIFTRM